jgi:DNA-binding cell septation regulator SpoVG
MAEPHFGYKNVIKSKKEGKVKAFFNLLIPTESIGTIELSGFKVIDGTEGLFISLPNRATKVMKPKTVTTATGSVQSMVEEIKYFNDIRFESQKKYYEFRDILNKEVLPLIVEQLSI